MKITNLRINNFGNIKQRKIEFGERITLIQGKNESGKSTILKFIQGMFYGLSRNKNGKDISDYERYTPWKGEEFSGKLNYNLDSGKSYEIYRDFKKKNPQVLDENAQDVTKEYTIDKTKGSQFFIEQVKMEEDLFLSTVLIEQESVKLNEKEQTALLQKTANILGTGEDSVSFQKTIQKLNKRLLNDIGTSRSQDRPINIIEQRMNQVQLQIQELKMFQEEKYNKQKKKQEQEEKIKKLQYELEFFKEIMKVRVEKKNNLQQVQWNKQIQEEYQEKIKQLKNNRKQIPKTKKNNLTFALGLIITAILALINITTIKNTIIHIIEIISAITVTIWYFIDCTNKNKEIQAVENENKANEEKIEMLEVTIKEKQQEANKVEEEINKEILLKEEIIKNRYINLLEKEEVKRCSNIEDLTPNIEFIQNTINEIKLNIHRIEIEEANILPKLETLNSLQEEWEELNEQYQQLLEEAKFIQIAKQEIENAYEEMKNTITPKFTAKLSANMEKISNGKYKNIKIQNEKGLIVENQDGNYVNADILSIGTIDQLYFSLRLGTLEEIVEEKMPILLDETFAFFDDERLRNILQFLSTQYKDRQIVIFTCTNREKDILEQEKINFTLVKL